ncbi:MAG: NAD(P)H-binding protein [Gemmatimonadota bacterium]
MDYREVLVTGGTGFLGRHVVRALVARGFLPRLLVRAGSEERIPGDIRSACRVTPGDATDAESVENAVQGTGAIVHLAGIVRECPGRGVTFERVHVTATRNLVKAARRWDIPRYVHVGALGARPGDPRAFFDSKGRGEEIVRNSGLLWTIVRPSAIFGPGDGFVDALLRVLRRSPVAPVPGDGAVTFQPVFAGDVAAAIADAVSRRAAAGRSVDLGGPERLSLDAIVDAVGAALGRRIAKAHVPLPLVRSAVRVLSRFDGFPVSPAEIDFLTADSVCESGPYWAEIGRMPVSLGEYLGSIAGGRPASPVDVPGVGAPPAGEGRTPGTPRREAPPSEKAA